MHKHLCRTAAAQEINDQVQHLRVQNRRRLEMLARGRRPGKDEDSGTNDCANAQRG